MKTIDLNCDMGESFGAWHMGDDEAVLPHVSSINVACGLHAGEFLIGRLCRNGDGQERGGGRKRGAGLQKSPPRRA